MQGKFRTATKVQEIVPETSRRETKIGAIVAPAVKEQIEEWAEAEGRSERSHVSLLLRKLVTLRQQQPAKLQELGLLDGLAAG